MAMFLAWAVGQGIVVYRSVKVQGGPPWPGQLLWSSGLFVILGILAEAGPGARRLAITAAWGFNVAAFMNVAGSNNAMVFGNNQAGTTWWATVKQNQICGSSVLPGAGNCSGTKGGCASSGTSAPSPGQQIASGEQAPTNIGGCPSGRVQCPWDPPGTCNCYVAGMGTGSTSGNITNNSVTGTPPVQAAPTGPGIAAQVPTPPPLTSPGGALA